MRFALRPSLLVLLSAALVFGVVTDLVAAGIHVLAPDGKVLDFIPTGGAPSNLAFDGETLWVTNAGVLAASTEPSTAGTIQRLRIPGGGAPTHKGAIRGSVGP